MAKSDISLCLEAVADLDAEVDCPEDVLDIEAKLDAIASALIGPACIAAGATSAAVPLPTILKQLAKKHRMANQAVEAAEFLIGLSRRAHYLDDIDDEAVDDAESKRQSLVNDLRNFLNRVNDQ